MVNAKNSDMAVIEYGPDRPHGGGFVGLRVFVKKTGSKPFQKYFSFKGCTYSERLVIRKEAEAINAREVQDAKLRLQSRRLYQPSRSELSDVFGISVGITRRTKDAGGYRYEIVINVAGASREVNAAGSLAVFTKALNRFDYFWFEQAWRKACRTLAVSKGYQRTPTRWYQALPTQEAVTRFIARKTGGASG